MLEQLISFIPALANIDITLLRASNAGLVTIENASVNQFNVLITGSRLERLPPDEPRTTAKSSSHSPQPQNHDSPLPHPGPLSLRIPALDTDPGNTSIHLQPLSIPFSTGLHFDFTDDTGHPANWWHSTPTYLDMARNLRFVPFLGPNHSFPSLESPERIITVRLTSEALQISRQADRIHFSVPLDKKLSSRTLRFTSNSRHWSLRYLRPNILSKLEVNAQTITIQYRRSAFNQLWWLTNHHPSRGAQCYLLLHKAQPE